MYIKNGNKLVMIPIYNSNLEYFQKIYLSQYTYFLPVEVFREIDPKY